MFNMMLGEVAPGGTGSGLYGMLDPRGHHGLRRRADGRAHAGVPGQEDRRPGDQVRLAVLPDHADARPGRHRRSRWPLPGATRRHAQHRRARPVRGALRVHLGGQQQRLRVRRASPSTPPGTTPRSGCACSSAGSCRWSSCSAWPARWPSRSRCPSPRGTLPTYQPLFVGMLVGVTLIVVALTYLPGARARPAGRRSALMTTADCQHGRSAGRPRQPPAARRRRAGSAAGCSTPSSCGSPLPDALRKLNPAHAVAQPGHVHRRDRRRCSPPSSRSRTPPCSPG